MINNEDKQPKPYDYCYRVLSNPEIMGDIFPPGYPRVYSVDEVIFDIKINLDPIILINHKEETNETNVKN